MKKAALSLGPNCPLRTEIWGWCHPIIQMRLFMKDSCPRDLWQPSWQLSDHMPYEYRDWSELLTGPASLQGPYNAVSELVYHHPNPRKQTQKNFA